MRLKAGPKLVGVGALFCGLFFGTRYLVQSGIIHMPGATTEVPKIVELPALPDAPVANAPPPVAMPGPKTMTKGTDIRIDIWAWNAHMGALFANGGPSTTEGSIMASHGINLHVRRIDDVPKMRASLLELATAIQKDPESTSGTHFITLMGDGTAAFFADINPALRKICDDCTAEVVGSCGYSRGEDKFMGLPEWKKNPKLAKGALIAGVLRDGDWNIAMKWAGDNNIKNNPDETTYDPETLNWVSVDNYIDAGKKYILGTCEDRKVTNNGKPTGETKHVCVNGVVTWTPGDVNVAREKGGLADIADTKMYPSQMPNVIIGIHKWDKAHPVAVENMLAGIFEGGDQVKHYPSALQRGGEISAAVYGEENAAYWVKYYKGVTEPDKQGIPSELGGSTVNNYADNERLFGLTGGTNLYAVTYQSFGDIAVQQYPKLVPSYPKVETILDTSYLKALKGKVQTAEADRPKFAANAAITQVVAKKNWEVHFETGKATFTKDTEAELEKLFRSLIISDSLLVEIHGHTDNTGDATANMALSDARAQAVRDWLVKKDPEEFSGRLKPVPHGQLMPVCTKDNSEACRSQNRRVVVIMGST